MHDAAREHVRTILQQVPNRRGPVVEIGGRDINGTIRPLFADIGPYASIDLYDGPGVDLVGDVCALPPATTARKLFGRPTVTWVVCCEVLEHAVEPARVCRWAYRILEPGGTFIVTAANPYRAEHSGIDGAALQDGEHYQGVSERALKFWLQQFSKSLIDEVGSDIYAVAWKGKRR
jgi:SAM-dependent methyltransferase